VSPLAIAAVWVGLGLVAGALPRRRYARLVAVVPLAGAGLTLLATRSAVPALPLGGLSAITGLDRAGQGLLVVAGVSMALVFALQPAIDVSVARTVGVLGGAATLAMASSDPLVTALVLTAAVGTLALRWIAQAPGRATLAAGRVAGSGTAALVAASPFLPLTGFTTGARPLVVATLLVAGVASLLAVYPLGGWAAAILGSLRPLEVAPWLVLLVPVVLLLAEQSGPMREATTFRRHIAGAESNVAIGLSRLGHTAGWFSRVGDDEFGRAVAFRIRGEGVDTSHVLHDTHASTGMVVRERREAGPIEQVYYRAGSAASRMSAADLDPAYLADARFVHLTGITPALSASCRETVFAAAEMARAAGVTVVLDPNYRSKLWDKTEARSVMRDLAARCDLLLPGMDGMAICRQLRRDGVATPILMLTARDAIGDRVRGLDAGADDYLVKPFALTELLARIRALGRRGEARLGSEALTVGDLRLDLEQRQATRGDRTIDLTAKEFQLLEYLMRHAGRLLTKDQITQHVWGYDAEVSSNVAEIYIHYLRDKIDRGFAVPLIRTVRGAGYMLKE